MPFDFDASVAAFRRTLAIRPSIDPSLHAELEASLHDRYEENLVHGLLPEAAFAAARERVLPRLEADDASPADGLPTWLRLLPSYVKTGLRSLRSRWGYSVINFVSLSIGMFTVVLAALYIQYETNYDVFVPEIDRKYRMARNYRSQGYSVVALPDYFSTTRAGQLAQLTAIEEVPGVEQAAQFFVFEEPVFVRDGERKLPVENVLQTNTPQRFLDFFGWPLLEGSVTTFVAQSPSVLLTQAEADRIYGDAWKELGVVGQVLRIDTTDYTVAGVLADVPGNAHFTFSLALHVPRINYWGVRLYTKLVPGADPTAVAAAIDADIGRVNASLAEDELFAGTMLQPLASVHLNSTLLYEMKPPGDPRYLYLIGLIAGIVLLLTVINYANLSVAMNAGRTREIGMRKVFGASPWQVAAQFTLEALLLAGLAAPVVAVALSVTLPYVDVVMETTLANAYGAGWSGLGWLLGVSLAVGLLASVYPALSLSRQKVLGLFGKGLSGKTVGGWSVRKVLVGAQFALLIGLCSLAIYVNRQLSFLQGADLGYQREGVLYVNVRGDSAQFARLAAELTKLPEVRGVGADGFLGTTSYNQTTYQLDGTPDVFDDAHQVNMSIASAELLGLKVQARQYATAADRPSRQVLINETLAQRYAQRYGIAAADLPGRTLVVEPEYVDAETGEVGFPVVLDGTFADINMFSLRQAVEPMILVLRESPRYVYWATVGYEGVGPAEIRRKVEAIYAQIAPEETFVHAFLEDNLTELYAAERRIALLSTLFSAVAFCVALIGLVALTAYLTTQRQKEIGIRRILGASTWAVVRRFNREYLVLVAVAFALVAPFTYWGSAQWLSGFAYRITLTWWVPVVAMLLTALVTVLVVSVVTWRAARTVPARVLEG